MILSDKLADFFLFFNHEITLIPLIVVGFIVFKRSVFGQAFYLLLFTMIFNSLLKSIFQIPLSPSLGKEGFAFPSGHMQVSFVFYGWLMMAFPSLSLRILLCFLLTGIGWALVHFGYHNWLDVLGALGFGFLTLTGYKIVSHYFVFLQKKPYLTGIFLLPLAILMLACLHWTAKIPAHAWMAFYALVGFASSWGLTCQSLREARWKEKGLALCLCVLGITLIYSLFQKTFLKMQPAPIAQLQYFIAAFLLPVSIRLFQKKVF
jgi:undecaprenyl-diphosphatase